MSLFVKYAVGHNDSTNERPRYPSSRTRPNHKLPAPHKINPSFNSTMSCPFTAGGDAEADTEKLNISLSPI